MGEGSPLLLRSQLEPRKKRRKENKEKERCDLQTKTKTGVKEESRKRACQAEYTEMEQGREEASLDLIL